MSANSSPERIHQGSQLIPPQRLLNSILDRLQKKDKFGVFAEPVDEKEVPNYYDIIKDPMDFGTIRSRISCSHYSSLELFQRDIFLICDNAMQYNGKGTVYFRHARAIKDTSERIFEDLKFSGLSLEMDEPTAAKLKNGGTCRINDKHDSSMTAGSPSETRTDNLDDVSGYLLKSSGFTDGRRFQSFDENCRSTYAPLTTVYQGNDSLSTTISGESLHLVPTGYQVDFPYSKSLSRFAADLGPLVWKIAAEKIQKSLPPGCLFGPGWVGERETSGVLLTTSTSKQGLPGQAAIQQATRLPCENGAITASETNALPPVELKPENQLRSQVKQETAADAERQPSSQDLTNRPAEIRSPMVFGNSFAQFEKSEQTDYQVLRQSTNQPVANVLSPGSGRPLAQARVQSNRESAEKLDQMSLLGNKSKFAGQVNLNHPVSLPLEDGGIVNDHASVRDLAFNGRDGPEVKTAVAGAAALRMGNVGGLPFVAGFNLGGMYDSKAPQTDKLNPLKARMGETGMITSIRNQSDGRCASQPNPFNSLNDSSCLKASSIAPGVGVSDAIHRADNPHVTCGPIMAHNLNMPLQQPSAMRRDGSSFDPACSALSQPQLAQIFALQSRLNTVVQKTTETRQHSNSNEHQGSRDVSPPEQALSTLPAPSCPERVIGERFSESGDLREKEMLSLAGRMNSGVRKGYYPEKGPETQHLEEKNGQILPSDMVNRTVNNLAQLTRKQNAHRALSVASFPAMLPSSNAVTTACEVRSWVPAQQTDSVCVNGKGGTRFQSQAINNPLECSENSSGGVPPMRPQTTGSQDPPLYSFGIKKHKSGMPHFLEQQLVSNNSHGIFSQNHQVRLHGQSNSLPPGVQNSSPSNSAESSFVRQFQPTGHPSLPQASNLPWQYMAPQIVAHGAYQPPLAMAPDLNVSLPLTKSSFDQPNGNEVQQPDLALQL